MPVSGLHSQQGAPQGAPRCPVPSEPRVHPRSGRPRPWVFTTHRFAFPKIAKLRALASASQVGHTPPQAGPETRGHGGPEPRSPEPIALTTHRRPGFRSGPRHPTLRFSLRKAAATLPRVSPWAIGPTAWAQLMSLGHILVILRLCHCHCCSTCPGELGEALTSREARRAVSCERRPQRPADGSWDRAPRLAQNSGLR